MKCFILSECMKAWYMRSHSRRGWICFPLVADSPEEYHRKAFVMARTRKTQTRLDLQSQLQDEESLVSISCVQCAYLAAIGWTGS